MTKEEQKQLDEGYGFIGNIKHYIIMEPMEADEEKEYRAKLEKQNKTKYEEYLAWEKRIKG